MDYGQIRNKFHLRLKAASNCWICEGWTEFKFVLEPPNPDSIDNDTTPVMLHTSCDDYQGELLVRENSYEMVYSTIRMLPPGEVTFYYSVNGEPCLQSDHPATEAIHTQHAGHLQRLKVPKTNIIENVVQTEQLLDKTFLTNMVCIPRPPPKNLKGREKVKTPWDFGKSVFKDYRPDNAQLLEQCFEFDWSCSKIEKVIKGESELVECKAFLKSIYKTM